MRGHGRIHLYWKRSPSIVSAFYAIRHFHHGGLSRNNIHLHRHYMQDLPPDRIVRGAFLRSGVSASSARALSWIGRLTIIVEGVT